MLNFKEWLQNSEYNFNDSEIAGMYFHNSDIKVRDIAKKTNKSVAEVYRILHRFGSPNRKISNHANVFSFAEAGWPINKIAEFTGYTPRNVRYILKRNN